jgi:hypothetical protein
MNLVEEFERMSALAIDDNGIYPHNGMVVDKDDKLCLCALDLKPAEVFQWLWQQVTVESAKEVIFGLDRSTKPGQGTEFDDVLTCCHWREDLADKWNRAYRIGVINYQIEPRIVRPIDWDNEFWKKQMGAEVRQFTPPFRMVVKKGVPEV